MQVVIDINEYEYKRAKELVSSGLFDYEGITPHLFKSVANGTPLPKGHGALKDTDMLLKYGSCPNDCVGTPTCDESYEHLHCPFRVFDLESINDTPTIIEADKGE